MSVDEPYHERTQGPRLTLVRVPGEAEFSAKFVRSVQELLERNLRDLPPLTESIDPDILEALYGEGESPFDGQLTFDYAGHRITVFSAASSSSDRNGGLRYVFVAVRDKP